jgi:hypothetical protein
MAVEIIDLIDVTQSLQALGNLFPGVTATLVGGKQALHFFLNRVQHEFLNRSVARRLSTLFGLFQQLAFELDFL